MRRFLRFSLAGSVFCSPERFVLVDQGLTRVQTTLLSGLRSRLVVVVVEDSWLWALNPAVEPEPCTCLLLCHGRAVIALWAPGKSEGILCLHQAKQSCWINSENKDSRLAQANSNIQFKMYRNDNQMLKTCFLPRSQEFCKEKELMETVRHGSYPPKWDLTQQSTLLQKRYFIFRDYPWDLSMDHNQLQ